MNGKQEQGSSPNNKTALLSRPKEDARPEHGRILYLARQKEDKR